MKKTLLFAALFLVAFTANAKKSISGQAENDRSNLDSTAILMEEPLPVASAFLIKNGNLDEIKSFSFEINNAAIKKQFSNADPKITFQQTKAMILPYMKMIHFVGILSIDGVKKMTYFQLAYDVIDQNNIRISGNKKIKMSDFRDDILFADDVINGKEEINLDIDLILKNNSVVLSL